jgi:hypothetical protein
LRESGDGNEAEIRSAAGKTLGALRGHHAFDVVALGQWNRMGRVVEVPHERCGIQEADGSDTKTAH